MFKCLILKVWRNKKEAFKNDLEDSEYKEIIVEQEIEVAVRHADNSISIGGIFDWREIHKENYKNEIIHKAHTFHNDYHKAGNTLNK